MTDKQAQIDFYILNDADSQRRYHFFCKLIEKSNQQGNKNLILCHDDDTLSLINQSLWSFKKTSFVPHNQFSDNETTPTSRIILATSKDLKKLKNLSFDVVFDLSTEIIQDFSRIIIVTNQHKEVLANSRMKYKAYCNLGIKPITHQIDKPKNN